MANGMKFIPMKGVNTDLSPQFMNPEQAYFIKNLYYELTDQANSGTSKGSQLGVMKPLQGNALYAPFTLPNGENYCIGTYHERGLSKLYIFIFNDQNNHSIYRINGISGTVDTIYIGQELEFVYEPQYFIHESGANVQFINLTDPATNEQVVRTFLFWTNGTARQKFLCVEDSIATNSFNSSTFTYFTGNYDKRLLTSVGQPHFMDCFGISEIPLDPIIDLGKNNALLFHGIQFRITYIDVWGRPSEHSIISDLYIPTYNSCSNDVTNLARRLNLTFDAGIPTIDQIQVEYSFDNSTQWYLETIIQKYEGSNIGDWWLRNRNTFPNNGFTYNPITNEITYIFSGDKMGEPLPVTETNRLFNPLPITSQVATNIGDAQGLCNNPYGFTPIDETTLNEIDFTIESLGTVASSTQLRNITVYAKLANNNAEMSGSGFESAIYNTNTTDLTKGYYCFGTNSTLGMKPYKQNFATDQQKGWLGYLAGTNNAVYSEQGYFDANSNFIVFTDDDYLNPVTNIFSKNCFQRWVFTGVIPSVYSFRIASHLSDTSVDYEKTSTYVKGLFTFDLVNGIPNFTETLVSLTDLNAYKEVIIDVTANNFDMLVDNPINSGSTRMLVINDLGLSGNVTAYFGYLYENSNNLVPIENVFLKTFASILGVPCVYTDYNGFWYFMCQGGGVTLTWNIMVNGVLKTINNVTNITTPIQIYSLFNVYVDEYIPLYSTKTTGTISNVTGNILVCNTTQGVSGIPIVMSNLRAVFTDSSGNYSIRIHLSTSGFHNSINLTNYYVFLTNNQYYSDCFGNIFRYPLNPTIVIGNATIWQLNYNLGTGYLTCSKVKTMLTGGRYSVGIAKNDWMDRQGNVNTIDKWFLTVPTISSTHNLQQYGIQINIPASVRFTPEVEKISIYVSAELNNQNYLTWVADQVDFVDNLGNINPNNPTQVRIWYQSLNQYNQQNNFNTTTGWQIIPTSTTSPRVSDTVEFIFNGDGTYFSTTGRRLVARIKYDSTGAYFLIDYTPDLAILKSGAFMRLVEPQANTGNITYYEQCHTIDVVNGVPQENKFILPFFDTYLIQRSVPVSTNVIDNLVTPSVTTTTYNLRTFGFPFEHNSPTDLWGKGIKNIGRINTKNNYENIVYKPFEVALSGVLSENGQLNYLCYYDDTLKNNFEFNTGIVYARWKSGIMLFLTEDDNYLVGYNDNLARTDSSGNIVVASAANLFGKPERKVSGNYGCLLFDKNTIREWDGLVHYLDSSRAAFIQHNFTNAYDVSRNNQANSTITSWLSKKIKSVNDFNRNSTTKRYFHGVVNPVNFEYLLTDYQMGANSYINNIRDYLVESNETFAFDILAKVWKCMYSFTPEYFGIIEQDNYNQNQLISLKQGLPYYHYDSSSTSSLTWNTFFGVPCNKVYHIVLGIDGQKKKTFRFIENYIKEHNYFSDDITTETNQVSRLMLSQFKKGEYFYQGAFLCNQLTNPDPNFPNVVNLNPVFEGDPLYGSWIKVRLVGDPAFDNTYSELTGVILHLTGREKSGS